MRVQRRRRPRSQRCDPRRGVEGDVRRVPRAASSRRESPSRPSVTVDYPRLVHGATRAESVRAFLASRDHASRGLTDDAPGSETVAGSRIERTSRSGNAWHSTARAFEGARLYLQLAHDASMRCVVVSGSTNTHAARSRTPHRVDRRLRGRAHDALRGLRRKPAPDMLVAACRHLGVGAAAHRSPETTTDGVDAACAALRAVIAVNRTEPRRPLRTHGASLVVADLGELLERHPPRDAGTGLGER